MSARAQGRRLGAWRARAARRLSNPALPSSDHLAAADRLAAEVIAELAAAADRYPDDERDSRWLGVDLGLARRARLAQRLRDERRIAEIIETALAEARREIAASEM